MDAMSYRLQADETLPAGIRRTGRELAAPSVTPPVTPPVTSL